MSLSKLSIEIVYPSSDVACAFAAIQAIVDEIQDGSAGRSAVDVLADYKFSIAPAIDTTVG